jgi:Phage P22-like portal protein
MDSMGSDPPSMLTGRPIDTSDPAPNDDDANSDLIGELPGVVDVADQEKPTGYEALDTKALTVDRVRSRYEEGTGAFEENRRLFSEDLNFIYNAESMGQWDPVVLQARQGKPCYTFNRVIGPVNLVIADMRQTRPAIKVRPSTQGASEATAEVFGGLIRSIEKDSRADVIFNSQFKNAVAGGYGAWYLMPEYISDKSFDQVLRIKDIPNPQTCVWDPEANDPCCGDAMWGMIGERISLDKYHSLYPDADASGTSFNWSRDSYGWFTDKEVRVVDYYERVPFKGEIALLSDGSVVTWDAKAKELEAHYALNDPDKDNDQLPRMVRTREVLKWRVMWVKVDGSQVLEGPRYYDWKRIPLVRIPGRYINIEGRKKLQSLIRHAKDAQRSYNSRCSDMIERSALIPKAPYLVTERMVKGYENEWAQANTASRPFLPYNADPSAEGSGGMPIRTPPIDLPSGALALAQMAQADIQATTGFFDPALGNADDMNRVSGKALVQHTRRSDLGSFEFTDGYRAALQLTAEIELDMIPTIYDTERVERIVGHDDVEKMVTINGSDGDVIHDLSEGSYGVTVTIGPSYQTARQETLQTLIDASETIPMIAQLCPDLLAKNLDTPDADEMVRRLRVGLIQAGIVQATAEEKKQIPPPPPPDPGQVAETQYMQARAQNEQAKVQVAQSKAQSSPLESHKQAIETAGKHLDNLLKAKELDQPQAAEEAENSQGSKPTTA